jgi:hypothetical protein
MGFAPILVQLVMTCVSTISYSILVNGQPYGAFTPSKGIRQRDPLSPYLFILCAEWLSALLRRAENKRELTSLSMSRGRIHINYLFFANDSLLFCRANIVEWLKIQEILETYERTSGQKINREKTALFFSKNTKRETQECLMEVAGVRST